MGEQKAKTRFVLFEDFEPPQRLVGIAKIAAKSEVLEAKRVVQYFELNSKSMLHHVKTGMPFEYGLNPYRGCEYGCQYCYARYTHEFMELRDSVDFEDRIYAKSNVAVILNRELKRIDGRRGIAIGTATDPYQPAERRFQRTRTALEVFAQHEGLDLSITTKSNLVARDVALLQEIQKHNAISVNMTVTTLDESLARILEPRAPGPSLRLKAVKKLAEGGIPVGVFPTPIMPLITDQEDRLDRLAKAAKDHGAVYFGGGVLFLMPCARRVFFPFVEKHFPHLLKRYEVRYERDAYLRGPYCETIRERIIAIRDKYGLKSRPPRGDLILREDRQGSLFV